MSHSFRRTKMGCYIGIVTQAVICSITPILFIPMMELYGFSYMQLGVLVGVNFVAQVAVDIIFSGMIDRLGYRKVALPAILCAVGGFFLFAASPFLFKNVYIGILLSVLLFAASGGLMEIMISPIVDAIPSDDKGASMSLMHSMFAWGQVLCIVVTTLFIFFFGGEYWQIIVLLWALVPLVDFFIFLKAPFPKTLSAEKRTKPIHLIFQPFLLIGLLAILCGASAELVMSQWSSAYMEKAMELPKVVGDLLGMCGFSVMLGVGRTFYGMKGAKLNMGRALIVCAGISAVCYLVVALSPWEWVNIFACAVAGLGASLLWPGTLVVCAERYPMGGAWVFAVLAAAGDIGGAIGPWLMGFIVDHSGQSGFSAWISGVYGTTPEQSAMRIGILILGIFPVIAAVCHVFLKRFLKKAHE